MSLLATPFLAPAGPAFAQTPPCAINPDGPRTLFIALDGVPFRVAQEVRDLGGFEDWPEPRPMISTFPSMTNVALAAMFQPLGLEPIAGYETRHFEWQANQLFGGGGAYGWRDYFQLAGHTNASKISLYLSPKRKARRIMRGIESLVMESDDEIILAHIASTDMTDHFRGDDKLIRLLLEIEADLEALTQRHIAAFDRPLRIVLLSDHGNTDQKVSTTKGLRDTLRNAGLRLAKKLEHPDDFVAPTWGIVNYGVLFLYPERAETAAQAIIQHPAVNIAAWVTSSTEVTVLSKQGRAGVVWRVEEGERSFAYRPDSGDPLALSSVTLRMAAAGLLDPNGYATEEHWFAHSALSDFPDAPRRLVDSLTGTYVTNAATVIFSIEPGYAWGATSARIGAWFLGGKLEGTHGGLDRDSTVGIFLTNDPQVQAEGPLAANDVLLPWSHLGECMFATTIEPN